MKPGDLVKYRNQAPGSKLHHLVGVVATIRKVKSGDRIRVVWNDPSRNWIWDWPGALEVVNEGR